MKENTDTTQLRLEIVGEKKNSQTQVTSALVALHKTDPIKLNRLEPYSVLIAHYNL